MDQEINIWAQVIFPYANFAIFFGLAIYFFRRPARNAAMKRREEFQKLVEEATKARDAAQARLSELAKREAELDQEIAELKHISKQSAESEAEKIVADAERVAQHLKEEAQRIAQAEVEKARATLRQEILTAVRDGVELRVKKEMNEDAQLRLVRKQIDELGSITAEG